MTATYKTLKVPWLSFSGNQDIIYANHTQWIKSYEKFELTISPHKLFGPFLLQGIDFYFLF